MDKHKLDEQMALSEQRIGDALLDLLKKVRKLLPGLSDEELAVLFPVLISSMKVKKK